MADFQGDVHGQPFCACDTFDAENSRTKAIGDKAKDSEERTRGAETEVIAVKIRAAPETTG